MLPGGLSPPDDHTRPLVAQTSPASGFTTVHLPVTPGSPATSSSSSSSSSGAGLAGLLKDPPEKPPFPAAKTVSVADLEGVSREQLRAMGLATAATAARQISDQDPDAPPQAAPVSDHPPVALAGSVVVTREERSVLDAMKRNINVARAVSLGLGIGEFVCSCGALAAFDRTRPRNVFGLILCSFAFAIAVVGLVGASRKVKTAMAVHVIGTVFMVLACSLLLRVLTTTAAGCDTGERDSGSEYCRKATGDRHRGGPWVGALLFFVITSGVASFVLRRYLFVKIRYHRAIQAQRKLAAGEVDGEPRSFVS
jgi:hypothetical protein